VANARKVFLALAGLCLRAMSPSDHHARTSRLLRSTMGSLRIFSRLMFWIGAALGVLVGSLVVSRSSFFQHLKSAGDLHLSWAVRWR